MESVYGLGIDAGGTYTDAVLMNFETGKVVGSSKALTTQPNPSEGIRVALSKMDPDLLVRVSMVSLATTFATNAIVEDRGAEAGLILVGYNELPPEIPRKTRVLMVEGGHTVSGEERAPLNLGIVERKLDTFLDGLDAVAVAGFFSVRNPDHELRVAQLIRDRYDLPVVRGHRLSMSLDALKRATTAWWNARLIPIISNLIKATKKVLSEKGIRAPLMVVRGDGTLMSGETALERPVDTLLSGPSASILGAKHLSGLNDALVVDMGGTTTDMASLIDGKVAIDPQGARVGKWKTHVQAARVRTIGIGGDSLISVNRDRELSVGPRRVVPLCVLSEQYPSVLEMLHSVLTLINMAPFQSVIPCSFYIRTGSQKNDRKSPLPDYLDSEPVSEFLLCKNTFKGSRSWELENYERQGLIFRSSLTPTDIRVAAGRFGLGNRDAAQLGLAIFARHLGIKESGFIESVEEKIREKLCLEAVALVGDKNDEALSRLVGRWFRQPSLNAKGVDLDVQVTLTAPVVGVGAPAGECLPKTFHRLHTECILPKAYDVCVAVGSVVGMVDITFTAKVMPDDSGRYVLHMDAGRQKFSTEKDAVEQGREHLEEVARDRMAQDHVARPLLEFTADKKKAKSGSGEEIHLETELRIRATGRPNVMEQGHKSN